MGVATRRMMIMKWRYTKEKTIKFTGYATIACQDFEVINFYDLYALQSYIVHYGQRNVIINNCSLTISYIGKESCRSERAYKTNQEKGKSITFTS